MTTRDRLADTMPALQEETATVRRVGSGRGQIAGGKSLRDILSGFRLSKAIPLASLLPERGPFADADKDDERR